MKNLTTYYALFIGTTLVIIRLLIYLGGNLYQSAAEVLYHMLPELTIALFCFAGGILMLAKRKRGKIYTLAGIAMSLYSALFSASHYVNDAALFLTFNVLAVITLPFLIMNIKNLMNPKSSGGK